MEMHLGQAKRDDMGRAQPGEAHCWCCVVELLLLMALVMLLVVVML